MQARRSRLYHLDNFSEIIFSSPRPDYFLQTIESFGAMQNLAVTLLRSFIYINVFRFELRNAEFRQAPVVIQIFSLG
jgi:hypothetical protein